jgi:PIN domain nuclease of toxin-antitoxin system
VGLLLDTHTLLWWVTGDPSLSDAGRRRIVQAQEVFVSAASAWEMAIKVGLGRLPVAIDLVNDFENELGKDNFRPLAITPAHGIRAGLLPGPHKDPFDRMLIAQAQAENLAIVSNDSMFDHYGVRRIW